MIYILKSKNKECIRLPSYKNYKVTKIFNKFIYIGKINKNNLLYNFYSTKHYIKYCNFVTYIYIYYTYSLLLLLLLLYYINKSCKLSIKILL